MMGKSGGSTATGAPPEDPLAEPAFTALRDLRREFGRGGLVVQGSPKEQARLVTFRVLGELWRLLNQFRRRVGSGEHCRLVVQDHPSEAGKLQLQVSIEAGR